MTDFDHRLETCFDSGIVDIQILDETPKLGFYPCIK
jgi:hypothetical protein